MKKTSFYVSLICLLTVSSQLFIACDKDDKGDTVKPVITLHEPEEGQVLKIGAKSGVHFEMDLSDDVMLKSYKIDIHNNFDNHTHATTKSADKVVFSFKKEYDVSGQKTAHIHHHDIVIPENAHEGNYHLMVYCTDAAGNSTYVARNIVLGHDADEHEHEHHHEH